MAFRVRVVGGGYQWVTETPTGINQRKQWLVVAVTGLALIEVFSRARAYVGEVVIMGNSVTERYKFLISLRICGWRNGWRRLPAAVFANRIKQIGK